MTEKTPKHILPVIVFAQFAGTSLWFAGNAVVDSLIEELGLGDDLLVILLLLSKPVLSSEH